MQITDKQLDRYIEIYQKHFGLLLNRESAREKGAKLAEAIKLVLQENKLNET